MTASNLASPLSPAAAASATANNNSGSPPNTTAALNVRQTSVQHDKHHERAVDRKLANASEPHYSNEKPPQVRRRKRDVFFALFKHASSSLPSPTKHESAAQSVPVQIPAGYTNPNHKGCLVSGRRVAYSRQMHHGRKVALVTTFELAIPEDEQVLNFPPTKMQLEKA
ncbi:hypothetical protein PybrP1_000041 [[Pythium] brassicae (nom. inval.)]|nr:hypothetical protein PybrP1_000041 [[Pythium] brassicae (nom. inval.)]